MTSADIIGGRKLFIPSELKKSSRGLCIVFFRNLVDYAKLTNLIATVKKLASISFVFEVLISHQVVVEHRRRKLV